MAKNFIKSAIKHPGALRTKAKKAGGLSDKGTIKPGFLAKALKSSNPTTRREAVLARTLKNVRK